MPILRHTKRRSVAAQLLWVRALRAGGTFGMLKCTGDLGSVVSGPSEGSGYVFSDNRGRALWASSQDWVL